MGIIKPSGLDRRHFLKSSGALIVGFSMAGRMPKALAANQWGQLDGPDEGLIDSWLTINADNTATIHSGYVNLGQGGPTALMQIAADELDMDFAQMSYATVDTAHSTYGGTVASATVGRGGPPLKAACAEARMKLLQMASKKLKFPLYALEIEGGIITADGNPKLRTSYGELIGGKPFGAAEKVTYRQRVKTVAEYKNVTKNVHRPDIEEKARGTHNYVQHMRLPGMLHGRLVRPRGQGLFGFQPKIVSIDESSIAHLQDVQIVRRGDFLGVVAVREWDAVRAAQQLKVEWQLAPATLPTTDGLSDALRQASERSDKDIVIDDGIKIDKRDHHFKGTFRGPYFSHGAFAPNCAVADVTETSAFVACSSQIIHLARNWIVKVLGMKPEQVRVEYGDGSCTFGMSCYDDCAVAAAVMSQLAKKPVRLQFSRADEFGWDNYCPPIVNDVEVSVDKDGKLKTFDYTGWSHGYCFVTSSEAFATGEPVTKLKNPGSSTNRTRLSQNAMYHVPARRMVDYEVYGPGLLRGGWMRSPLDPHYFFAAEQAMDHVAHLAGVDPLEFRRLNITNKRWLGVIEGAAKAANWQPKVAASNLSSEDIVTGRGIALGTHDVPVGNQEDRMTYAASVVDVQVNKKTGVVIATHVYTAMDPGLVVNPLIVENQIVGQACHGVSLALKEEVKFSNQAVTSLDWNSYNTLRHGEAPKVTPVVIQQLLERPAGAGEESLPAVVSATANAIFDATGVRMDRFPMTPERVLAALAAKASQKASQKA